MSQGRLSLPILACRLYNQLYTMVRIGLVLYFMLLFMTRQRRKVNIRTLKLRS